MSSTVTKTGGGGDDDDEDGDPFARPGMQDDGPRLLRRMDRSRSVPIDQQPFNELQQLKDAPMFGWAQKDLKGLVTRLAVVYGGAMAISFPIARTTFYGENELLETALAANVGALAVVTALVLRLYVGWSYIGKRLDSEIVEYEETGWYDGAEWYKPPDVRARDEMLNMYEVQPVMSRMRRVLIGIATALAVTVVAFKVVVPEDPYAIYNESYLQQLRTDDDEARDAARRSSQRSNKPTYCDTRFYRALAGQAGCD